MKTRLIFAAAILAASGCCSHGPAFRTMTKTLHDVRVGVLERPGAVTLHADKKKSKRLLAAVIERVKSNERLGKVAGE